MLALVYCFQSPTSSAFWAVSYATTGELTQLIFPDQELVLFDYGPDVAASVANVFETERVFFADSMMKPPAPASRRLVGVVDMVTNSGHQLINHLSGLEILASSGLYANLDEIWLCGSEFFGNTEQLFPELKHIIRRFEGLSDVAQEVARSPVLPLRIGSQMFRAALRERIISSARSRFSIIGNPGRNPLIAITVRAGGRRCINLPDVVKEIVECLIPQFPNLGLVIDGWVIPESEVVAGSSIGACVGPKFHRQVSADMDDALLLVDRLPHQLVSRSLVGSAMLSSILGLQDIKAYFSHVGTLQHKIGFFSDAKGVVHGPSDQLRSPEGGGYLSEVGFGPTLLDASSVRDVPVQSARGRGYYDYEIIDVGQCVELLRTILSEPC
jgi:hypothetical protein